MAVPFVKERMRPAIGRLEHDVVIDIYITGFRPVSIRNASRRGNITIGRAADARVSLDNVGFLFEGDGVIRIGWLPLLRYSPFFFVAVLCLSRNGRFSLKNSTCSRICLAKFVMPAEKAI